MNKKVSASGPLNAEVLLLGEFPDTDSELEGIPFSGDGGRYLDYALSLAGISFSTCRKTYLCSFKPYSKEFASLVDTPQLRTSVNDLEIYLKVHSPKIIITFGEAPFKHLTGLGAHTSRRGSVYKYKNSFVIPTFALYTFASGYNSDPQVPPILNFDLTKAAHVLKHGFNQPVHNFSLDCSYSHFASVANEAASVSHVSCDIETIRDTNHILCVGFATSATTGYCFRNKYPVGSGLDPSIADAVQRILNASKRTEFHNGLFDTEILGMYGIRSNTYDYDTMYAQRVIAPELPIGLDFCASIYTDEPYYKDDGKENAGKHSQSLWEYNLKDCICTWQIRERQQAILNSDSILRNTFAYQMSLIPLAQHFQSVGMPFDKERAELLGDIIDKRLEYYQSNLYAINGSPFLTSSPQQVNKFLYETLKLPTRTNRKTRKVSSDEKSIVSLITFTKKEMDSRKTEKSRNEWFMKLAALKLMLLVRGDEKIKSSYINVTTSSDGRLRSHVKIAGTETGRWSAGLYVDGTGWNFATAPRGYIESTKT